MNKLTFRPSFQIGRDARTGRFISLAEAKSRPATTIVQRIWLKLVKLPVKAKE